MQNSVHGSKSGFLVAKNLGPIENLGKNFYPCRKFRKQAKRKKEMLWITNQPVWGTPHRQGPLPGTPNIFSHSLSPPLYR